LITALKGLPFFYVGAELDLLCKHKVNKKVIYVECKAQRDPISAPVLRQLLGTVTSEYYSEGLLKHPEAKKLAYLGNKN
jgi:hypothetical protein